MAGAAGEVSTRRQQLVAVTTGADAAHPVPEPDLGRALSRLLRAVQRAKALAHVDGGRTDYTTFPLLVALAKDGPMRSSALAHAVLSDPSTVSRQVAHLVEGGLVERRADPADGRACHLALTAAGVATLHEHRELRDRYLLRLTEGWDDDDRRTLASLLHRLAEEVSRDIQERTSGARPIAAGNLGRAATPDASGTPPSRGAPASAVATFSTSDPTAGARNGDETAEAGPDEPGTDEPGSDQHGSDQHGSDQHGSDQHGTAEHGKDQHSSTDRPEEIP